MLLLYRKKRTKEYKAIKRNVIYGMSIVMGIILTIVYIVNSKEIQSVSSFDDYSHTSRNLLGTGDVYDPCTEDSDCGAYNTTWKCVVKEKCADVNIPYKLPGFYPTEIFTFKQLQKGAFLVYIVGVLYTFLAIAIICDEFFVPAIEVIVEKLNMSPDTAGATFMAAGGSAPELFTSFIGTFISEDSVGFGTIVGSAVFNVLFVIGCCAVFSLEPLALTWYPFARDCIYYSISLITLACFFIDGRIYVYEAGVLLLLYVGYVVLMMNNEKLYNFLDNKFNISNSKSKRNRAESQLKVTRAVTFNVSLFKLMTKDSNAADIAGIYLMKVHKGDIKDTFRKFDKDGNGTIDKQELKDVLRRLGNAEITEEELDACYKELDLNKDNKIDYAEFEKWFLRSRAKMNADIDSIFDKFDTDDDGVVDTKELKQLITEVNSGDEPTEKELEDATKQLDTNGDGKIDRAEFIQWYKDTAFFEKRVEKMREEADANDKIEEEDDDGITLCPPPKTCKSLISYIITFPIVALFMISIPDVRKKGCTGLWPLSLLMSMVWLAIYSWLMVWWATVFGNTLGIPSKIMGLTLLAAGTSVPDLITSVIVAKKGEGDMAVSSSIGSNIFDVLMGLPIPWFFYTFTIGLKKNGAAFIQVAKAGDPAIAISIGVLFAMLVIVLLLIKCNNWTMTKGLGYAMFVLYAVFVAQDLLQYYLKQ